MSDHLNPPQREAIRYLDGPLLVLAGAGSGKTRVITRKIAWLVEECAVLPQHIAAITFTNKAAKEMRERVGQLLKGRPVEGLTVSTFHALGARMLRQEARHAALKPGFSILDASDTGALFQELMKEADKSVQRIVQHRISLWKNALVEPEAALEEAGNELEKRAARIYTEYERTLRAYQAVDFDDLIRLPVKLLEGHPDVAERWRSRIWHLLVDEYQDTNRCQYRLMKLLAGPRAAFTAVGDDDQSIYAWRGADVENLRQLSVDYPQLKVIKLEQNYRSTSRILHAANTVIAHNEKLFEKKLWSEHGAGEAVTVVACQTPEHEAESVVMKLSAHKFEHRTHFKDYAILYRGNHQARLFEQQLRNHKIPYALSGGRSFFENAEIRDLCAYMRLIANEDDDLAFIRAITVPRRGVGPATLEALGRYAGHRHISLFAAAFEEGAAEHLGGRQIESLREFGHFINRVAHRAAREPAGPVVDDLLKAIGYEAWLYESCDPREAETKWSNVGDFTGWLGRKGEEDGKTLLDMIQTISLITMLDKDDAELDQVQLATLHASKGLEFKHVFLVGVEEGLLPHQSSIDEDKIEEERRLMYVGITRAQRSLTITYCERRKAGREVRSCDPSRFIDEMGDEGIRRSDRQSKEPVSKEDARARLANLRAMLGNKPGTIG